VYALADAIGGIAHRTMVLLATFAGSAGERLALTRGDFDSISAE